MCLFAFLWLSAIISGNSFIIQNKKVLSSRLNVFGPSNMKDLFGSKVGESWIYSDMFNTDKLKSIESVSITEDGNSAIVTDNLHKTNIIFPENLHFVKIIPGDMNHLIQQLIEHNVNINGLPEIHNDFADLLSKVGNAFTNIAIYVFVFSFVTTFLFNLNRNNPNGGNIPPILNKFNNDNFNVIDASSTNTTFKDVAGCDEAKYELMEVVDFLKNSDKYKCAGAKIPKGVLLEGSPGTGKTLMARAVAGEAGVPFISASGSEFIEMFVGVGASRVRELFSKAKQNSPCVIFIDEIDAIGRQRGAGIAGGNDEREQTLNQILTNMDGFDINDGIIVIAATNRIDILDSALTRPGRFDRKVKVPLPDTTGRKAIFDVHFRDKTLDNSVDTDELVTLTTGFSGADIANLANEAAIFSVRRNNTMIERIDLLDAYEKMTIGLPSNVQVKDQDIVELVSYHETGHAIMAALFDNMFDLRKVTINENKSGMGGYTLFTPKERFLKYATKKFMLANLIIALGGRAAEVYLYRKTQNEPETADYVFEDFHDLEITTGASNDLLQASNIARDYITTYGFGDFFYNVDNSNSDLPFIGREIGSGGSKISESFKSDVDKQISMLIHFAYHKALQLINDNEDDFLRIIELLKQKRTISGNEIKDILNCSV